MSIQTPITATLGTHLATRANSLDFGSFGLLLPNPDPILKAQGKDIATYRDMRTDSHIGGCIRRRKAAVQALEWGLDRGKSTSRAAKAVQAMLDDLKLGRIIGQMQECTLYGYQPMEVIWQPQGNQWAVQDILAKPPEWFCFDGDNALRLKTKASPLHGELVPGMKFLLPRQDPTYQNPYGFADLAMCFWPLMFKKNSLKFWLAFTEKFGSAFSVGKLPRNATDAERATLLDSLEALIQNGVATIPDDGSVELVEMAGKGASADLYEKLVMHCRSDIAIALLGQNQTTEASANKASATAGLQVTDDLRDGDAEIIADSINELIGWFCQLNLGDVVPPVFSFWDQEAQDKLQAERDKSNYEAGARFTNAYWMRGYGYQEGDLAAPAPLPAPLPAQAPAASPVPTPSASPTSTPQFAEATPATTPAPIATPPEQLADTLAQHADPQWQAMASTLQQLVDQATSLPQLQTQLLQAYGALDSDELVKLMAAAGALAELKGMDSAAGEGLSGSFAEPTLGPWPSPQDPRHPATTPIVFNPEININLRTDDIQASLNTALQTMAQAHAEKIKLIADAMPIHITLPEQPAPVVHMTLPEQAAPVVHITLPDQAAPAVNVTVAPAPVTVNNAFPRTAVQTVQRDRHDEITSTTTTYEK